MTVTALLEFDKKRLFEMIFEYHNLNLQSQALQTIWNEDLAQFSANEIKSAWDEWRMCENNARSKPKSADLLLILKSKKKNTLALTQTDRTQYYQAPPSDDWRVAAVNTYINTMKKNNPHLHEDIQLTQDGAEKALICASALNNPKIANHPAIQIFSKRADSRKATTDNQNTPEKRENATERHILDWEG